MGRCFSLVCGAINPAFAHIPRPWNISMTAPVIQTLENKNYFGSPIESRTLENLPVGERKTYDTSKLATALAGGLKGGILVLFYILIHAPKKPQRQLCEFYVDLERLKYERATDTLKGDDIRRYYRLNAASALLSAWRKKAVEYDKKETSRGLSRFIKRWKRYLVR